ncbi:hypothetical protein F6X39_05805 [Paraburkholderia sp. UCT2]|nr:hypothetical protein [Paraburkholderia sp. UCT2]
MYNSRRPHSTLEYVSRMTFEKNWFAAQEGRAAQISQLWDSPNRGKVMIQSATARPAVMFARSERPQSVSSRERFVFMPA